MKNLTLKNLRILQGKIFIIITCLLSLTALFLSSCEKFVAVNEVTDRILAEQVFESDATANAAIVGIYKDMRGNLPNAFSLNNSVASDEIVSYLNSIGSPYYTNKIQPSDTSLPWGSLYGYIYACNNAIEKLSLSKGISEDSKRHYIAEAKFLRAFSYFYLVNFFGDVPLVLTTNVQTNSHISRTPTAQVYEQITNDLLQARTDLGGDYSNANGEKIRANKWVATALLARVYLYRNDAVNAEAMANEVISSGKYSLQTNPAGIFAKNNVEVMLQWSNNSTESNLLASTYLYTSVPNVVLTSFLLNAFEPNDLRKSTWVKEQSYSGQPVFIPFKFTTTNTNPPEYYTLIRFVEMYLIRAEALAMRGDFTGCIADVNLIRSKHGGINIPLSAPANKEAALDVILHERQVDLFIEGCHRWFDLKRTGRLNAVMQAEKPTTWTSTAAFYPVPLVEIQRNPNLTPTPGYIY